MSRPQQVLLVLGAGGNVGLATVRKFKTEGFKVAAVSRNPTDEVRSAADLVLSADFADPQSIAGVFEKVESELGTPNVVVYNGMARISIPYQPDTLSGPGSQRKEAIQPPPPPPQNFC